ncbi:MAG TPA: GNAT family N-acetyltransferase [Candidatus Copromorpha excrementipullorum]|uniref:GNAT family N-acetyltransferase n=1 Tax=Candidatus Allocopromorpha excrementipullorum TaxID=2840743 RepID=A0A9D1N6Q9_9FIRM|nr:GNAT family N-acetyltransferase [Candidatus Copromorpha excrementipullorum]
MIRKATKKDLDSVVRIYESVLIEEEKRNEKMVGWVRGIYPTDKTALDGLEQGSLFVYQEGDRIVATAKMDNVQAPEYAECDWGYDVPYDKVMVLHTLAVDPECSGRGYGGKFIDFYEKYAPENGCDYLRIDTNVKNTIARHIYEKHGYSRAGTVKCSFKGINDVYLACFEKKL